MVTPPPPPPSSSTSGAVESSRMLDADLYVLVLFFKYVGEKEMADTVVWAAGSEEPVNFGFFQIF